MPTLSRHRGVRQRQYSYDEEEYENYEEEDDGLTLEQQREIYGHGGDSNGALDAQSNLASYYAAASGGAAAAAAAAGGNTANDAALVAGIVAAVEARFGKGVYERQEIEAASRDSGYDLDTVAAILETDRQRPDGDSAPQLPLQSSAAKTPSKSALPAPPGLGPPSAGVAHRVTPERELGAGIALHGTPLALGSGGLVPTNIPTAAAAGIATVSFEEPRAGSGGGNGSSSSSSSAAQAGAPSTPGASNGTADAAAARLARMRVEGTVRTPGSSRDASPASMAASGSRRSQAAGAGAQAASPQSARDRALEAAIAEDDEGRPDSEEEAESGEGAGKPRLSMVVIGHVDAGKSTLMGQLLVQTGHVGQRVLHKHEKQAKEAGKGASHLAWLMDETEEERAHGVTVDVAQRTIETPNRTLTLLDAPGHRDFIPRMITGAAQADAAVLVVPAPRGEFETAFAAGGQTKEHAVLAKALGVTQLLVAINKLDATEPPWSQERYEAARAALQPYLAGLGFKPRRVRFVPVSGLSGENVARREAQGQLSSWYSGPTFLEAVDAFLAAPRSTERPFRLAVGDAVAGARGGVTVSGRVLQGRVRPNERVLVMPLGDVATASRLERNGVPVSKAVAGDSVELSLGGTTLERVAAGNVLCKARTPVPAARRLDCQIMVLPALEMPVVKGTEFQLHTHAIDAVVHCSRLIALVDGAGDVTRPRPRCLSAGDTAHVRLTSARPLCLERYGDCRPLGRFVLRQRGSTVAVGIVLDVD